MRLGLDGEPGPLWLMAHTQTAGRGRSGRAWVSLPGNLHASLVVRPGCPLAAASKLSLVAGVAATDALRAVAGSTALPGLRVKWPNDVLIADAKIGGILIESSVAGPDADLVVVIGFGLNLASSPIDPARRTTHLAGHGLMIQPRAMLDSLAAAMHMWLQRWDRGLGFAEIREAWLQRAGPPGERLSVNAGRGVVDGTFAGIDGEGSLLMRDADGRVLRFTFGDVTLPGEGRGDEFRQDGK